MNKNITSLANFIFNICYTALFEYINLDKLIALVISNIMSINTPFLLHFANIDKLCVFFNNIINELLNNKFIYLVVYRYSHDFLM